MGLIQYLPLKRAFFLVSGGGGAIFSQMHVNIYLNKNNNSRFLYLM